MDNASAGILTTAAVVIAALLLFGAFLSGQVLSAELVDGRPDRDACCKLNYSDPRGYLYKFQDKTYYEIRIDPGNWNRISDYEVKITLPRELEFADIYMDQGFEVTKPLMLEPSASNDILLYHRAGDAFRSPRWILFTTKHRNDPGSEKIQVSLRSGANVFTHEF